MWVWVCVSVCVRVFVSVCLFTCVSEGTLVCRGFYECGPVRVGARARGCTGGRCFYECGTVRGVHVPGENPGVSPDD